ncbi:MAG: tetratricopeptide repeat-containing protein [bacterium]
MNCRNIPPHNPFFTGREEILKKLHVLLTSGEGAAIVQPHIIFGPSGVGKTQIAIEYAHRHQDEYQAMLWVQASTRLSLISGFTAIASLLNLPGKDSHDQNLVVDMVKQWLDENNRWLLILDDAGVDGSQDVSGDGQPDLVKELANEDDENNHHPHPTSPFKGEEYNESLPFKGEEGNESSLLDFLPEHPKGHILLTCRAQGFPVPSTSRQVKITAMLPDEAVRFLSVRTGRNGNYPEDAPGNGGGEKGEGEKAALTPGEEAACGFIEEYAAGDLAKEGAAPEPAAEEAAAWEIAQELGCLPLALELAGAYITAKSLHFQDYLTRLRRQHKEVSAKSRPGAMKRDGDYPSSVAAALEMSFQEVEKSSGAAADLLRFFTFLAPDSIPGQLPVSGASQLGPAISAALAGAGKTTPYHLDTAAADPPPSVIMPVKSPLDRLLEPLVSYSLIHSVGFAGSVACCVHRLIQAVLQGSMRMNKVSYRLWAERSIRALSQAFPEIAFPTRPLCDSLLPHVRAVADVTGHVHFGFPEAARLFNQAGYYLYTRARYAEAEPFYKLALAIWERILKLEHRPAHRLDYPDATAGADPDNLRVLSSGAQAPYAQAHYAKTHCDRDRHVQAKPLSPQASALSMSPDHLNAAQNLNHLAVLYDVQGKYAEAAQLYRQALEIRERTLGPDHPDVAKNIDNLATIYYTQGKYADAAMLYRRALEIRERSLGPDHPDVGRNLTNLAVVSFNQGKYQEAEQLFRRVLAIREKTLGPDHQEVIADLNNLVTIYTVQGRYKEAKPLSRRVSAIRKKAFGPDHPGVAQSLSNLAELHRSQGRYAEAEELHRRALAMREKTLGLKHPEVAQSLYNLAVLSCNQGRQAEAEQLFRRALTIREKALGPDHPDLGPCLTNLAAIHYSEGRYAEASELHRRVLGIREKTLGPDHPDMAECLENYADLLRKAGGNEAGVKEVEARAAAIRTRTGYGKNRLYPV